MEFERIRTAFQEIWGYEEFRYPQAEIIQTILAHKDALVVMPTGGGKSICFQLPALLQTGITLVVSPLVALMENQVQELRDRQLKAATLHSQLPTNRRKQVLQQLERQTLRLLYLSPETLLSPPVWERLCLPKLQINALILDEAHCLAQWGDSFRPAYERLGAVRPSLLEHKPKGTKLAIAAFTATADPRSQQTIQQTLALQNPQTIVLNPYRKNLYLNVKIAWSLRGRREQMKRFIRTQNGQSGLVYVRTRSDSEKLARWLQHNGFQTAAYHGGLSPEERRSIETQWLRDRLQSVVCTSAFGMGINKPNVRWIVHFHPPLLLSEYLQEIGRAGRDGKPATALTLISEPTGWLDPGDKQRYQYFRENQRSQQQQARTLAKQLPKTGDIREIARHYPKAPMALSLLHRNQQLEWNSPFHYQILSSRSSNLLTEQSEMQAMQRYWITCQCRWKFLLQALGHTTKKDYRCLHCDRCQGKIG